MHRGVQPALDVEEMMHQVEERQQVVNPHSVVLRLRSDYAHGSMDHFSRVLEDLCGLSWSVGRTDAHLQGFLTRIADLISKDFGISSVAIAARDPDKLYRYKAVNGIDRVASEDLRRIVYTKAQVVDDATYPGHEISSRTKIYLTEDHPYSREEESSYRMPSLIGLKRHAVTDCLEADYLDFFFYTPDNDILGWIETSGTRTRKLPSGTAIKWIELIAIMVGQALQARK